MKLLKLYLLLILTLLVFQEVFAQKTKEIKNEAVPQVVQDAFHTESMNEAPKKWEERTLKNGQKRYVAFYTEANFKAKLFINAKGDKLRRVFEGMENGAFNEACDAAALKQFPGYTIKSHEMVFIFAGEKTIYRNVLEKAGKKAVFLCDGEGKPLKKSSLEDE